MNHNKELKSLHLRQNKAVEAEKMTTTLPPEGAKSTFFCKKKLLFFANKSTFFYKKKVTFFCKKKYFFLPKKSTLRHMTTCIEQI